MLRRLCVYCGSRSGHSATYAKVVHRFGRLLAARGIGVVYGGGRVGLMGVLADAVREAGGEVQGVIPHALAEREVAHGGLSALHVVDTMHERKALMAELADGFVALPGGLGTLEELFEVWTWAQLGIHGKPCGLLNVAGYFDGLLAFLDHGVAEGFVPPRHRAMLRAEAEPERLLAWMAAYEPPAVPQWVARDAT